ncbi:TerD family protein [Deinococcus pimensis]|uniref:TerD family protein n=1 Tax=Deinococcus pimensis TaxID=309888 RepID=UPI00048519E9|nr:TerD family protein [Deinococcus pimensis]
MTISLKKQQTISLEKQGQGLTRVFMGLGWDVARGLFGLGGSDIDLDASCLMFDERGNVVDTVWFRQLSSRDGSVRHGGDNLTGAGDGDDERIFVDLGRVPQNVRSLVFTVNSFRGQTFAKVKNAFCRVVDETTGQEIAKLDLSEQGNHTGLVMARMQRGGSGWQLTAIGERTEGRVVEQLVTDARRFL